MQNVHSLETGSLSSPSFIEGLAEYSCEREALLIENSNDAVHFLYPDRLAENIQRFLNGFCGETLYAMKANPHPALLKFMWQQGVKKFETASIREIEFLNELLPEARLYFMHPIKSRYAIAKAYELGVRDFAFDCHDELKKIEEETGFASDLNLYLRLHVEQSSALHPLSGKFGVMGLEAPLLLQRAAQSSERLGVTFHVGSQCMEPSAYVTSLAKVREVVDQSGVEINSIDIGGGFPISYPGKEAMPLDHFFDEIHKALDAFGFSELDILCEPGRALVGNGGAMAARVEMRKGDTLYLNEGTYGALFDAGMCQWTYPLQTLSQTHDVTACAIKQFKLYGPTCDSLDVMEGPFELSENISEGDWVLFEHLGAYGYALQTGFNGFRSDAVVSIRPQR